jgi:hypothetical protein
MALTVKIVRDQDPSRQHGPRFDAAQLVLRRRVKPSVLLAANRIATGRGQHGVDSLLARLPEAAEADKPTFAQILDMIQSSAKRM